MLSLKEIQRGKGIDSSIAEHPTPFPLRQYKYVFQMGKFIYFFLIYTGHTGCLDNTKLCMYVCLPLQIMTSIRLTQYNEAPMSADSPATKKKM